MISVQNRLQLLSGSKYFLVLVWVTFASCNIIKSNPVVVEESTTEKPAKEYKTTEPEIHKKKKVNPFVKKTEVILQGQSFMVPPKKENFQIGLILPFHLGYKTSKQKRTASIMLDYYKGLKLALDELKALGFNATLTIYDNKNDSNVLKRILQKKELYKMDLIIGPIQERQVKIASRILKPYKIPLFSPFSSIGSLEDSNPVCFSFIPGYQLKAKQLVEYLEKNHKGEKLVIVRDGKSFDKQFVPYLIKELEKSGKIPFTKEAYQASIKWNILLKKDKKNVVYVASKQQNTVQNTLGGLIGAKRDVTVFGESNWMNFNDNDYQFWEKLNMHLLSTEFENLSDSLLMDVKLKFRETYNEDPSSYALRAYDQITFIGDFLMAFGEHFPGFIVNNSFEYNSTYFNFVPYNGCKQNKNLRILEFKDHRLKIAE